MRERWLVVNDVNGKIRLAEVTDSVEAWNKSIDFILEAKKNYPKKTFVPKVFKVVEVELQTPKSWEYIDENRNRR